MLETSASRCRNEPGWHVEKWISLRSINLVRNRSRFTDLRAKITNQQGKLKLRFEDWKWIEIIRFMGIMC